MEERLARVGRAAWWLSGIALVAVLLGIVGWVFRVVFPPLVLAGALVFLLNPIVSVLERRGLPRLFGTLVAFLGVVLLFAVLGAVLYPLIASQADDVSERWPRLQADAEEWIDDLSQRSDDDNWPVHLPSVEEIEDQADTGDDQELGEQVATLREYLVRAFHIGIIFVLGPFLAFYLLVDLPDVRRRVEELIPERSTREVQFLAHRLNAAIGGFFRGQLAVAFIVGVLVSIGLKAVVDLPLWLVVGMVAGVFNMIPLIGPWVGAVPGIVVALATKDVKAAIGVAVVMVVVQQIDNHFITPTVMRRAVQLHPAAVMIALLAWGTIGGFFGLLLAVPLTATAKIIGGHLWRKYVVGVSVPGLDEPYPDRAVVAAREDLPDERIEEAEAVEAEALGAAGSGSTSTATGEAGPAPA
ncbi:AI-2E family transporter [Iamia sp.]|uniref:AI-2E family transporter n=1 Tax=Iamia sp. TaxID=2722710 RepID=UPI002B57BDD0|nr:AI-2E family transporter [Iamia sp.]HXH55943.1 AI-2E family transporter [Iamia sp.]